MKNFLFPVDFFSNRVTLDQGLSGQAHRNEERLAGQGADPLVRGRPPGRPLAFGRKLIPNEERVQGDPRGPGGPPHCGSAEFQLCRKLNGIGLTLVPAPITRRPQSRRELVRPPDQLLQLVLDGVIELQAVGVEHLEAVVLGRVVRSRHHDPG